jgi:class 3 adenylate cyclase
MKGIETRQIKAEDVPQIIAIQQAHTDYNRGKEEPDQVQLRIGIHLGDIVIREGDVFGDGVNVASRVQPLAEPGGICVTRAVYNVSRGWN